MGEPESYQVPLEVACDVARIERSPFLRGEDQSGIQTEHDACDKSFDLNAAIAAVTGQAIADAAKAVAEAGKKTDEADPKKPDPKKPDPK